MRTAPQTCEPWYCKLACHGHWPATTSWPPQIFPITLGFPHTVETPLPLTIETLVVPQMPLPGRPCPLHRWENQGQASSGLAKMTALPGLYFHWLPLRIGQSKPCGDEDPEVWWDGARGDLGSPQQLTAASAGRRTSPSGAAKGWARHRPYFPQLAHLSAYSCRSKS